jgi:hypothetical protein
LTLLLKHHQTYLPVKYFLNSYRALSDGKSGIEQLKRQLATDGFLISNWKITWIGTCAILRTSIDLFKADARSCINADIRKSMKIEWDTIGSEKAKHTIFWDFLRRERDHIVHEYKWSAYEVWLDENGKHKIPELSLLTVKPENVKSVLMMRDGRFAGENSLVLLEESAKWVESRIFSAIERAGLDPEEYRRFSDFQPRPTLEKTLLS